ncbi:MAG: hypothetical protein ABW127_09810 [Candidatus Thiodiazotropha endolucinida]
MLVQYVIAFQAHKQAKLACIKYYSGGYQLDQFKHCRSAFAMIIFTFILLESGTAAPSFKAFRCPDDAKGLIDSSINSIVAISKNQTATYRSSTCTGNVMEFISKNIRRNHHTNKYRGTLTIANMGIGYRYKEPLDLLRMQYIRLDNKYIEESSRDYFKTQAKPYCEIFKLL